MPPLSNALVHSWHTYKTVKKQNEVRVMFLSLARLFFHYRCLILTPLVWQCADRARERDNRLRRAHRWMHAYTHTCCGWGEIRAGHRSYKHTHANMHKQKHTCISFGTPAAHIKHTGTVFYRADWSKLQRRSWCFGPQPNRELHNTKLTPFATQADACQQSFLLKGI